MSNPGVIALVHKTIGGQLLKIEDNIGESIHIHFGGNLRLDLSMAGFMDVAEQMAELLNRLVDIPGVDVRNLCPIYLNEQMREFADLERIKVDRVRLGSLLTEFTDENGCKYLGPIDQSRVSKALRDGDTRELLQREQCNLRGDTNKSRADAVFASIRDNGYPYNNEYIILHNDGHYIRDGLHRASCLLHLLGDVEVPVLRLYFRKNRHSDEEVMRHFELDNTIRKVLGRDTPEFPQLPLAEFWKSVLSELLRGKKIAVQEKDEVALRLLALLKRDMDIRCVLARDARQTKLLGVSVITYADIGKYDVDTLFVSSAEHYDNILAEMQHANSLHDTRYWILNMHDLWDRFYPGFASFISL
jgi:hypothetical protein